MARRKTGHEERALKWYWRAQYQLDNVRNRLHHALRGTHIDSNAAADAGDVAFEPFAKEIQRELDARRRNDGRSAFETGRLMVVGKWDKAYFRYCAKCKELWRKAEQHPPQLWEVAAKRKRKAGVQPNCQIWCDDCCRKANLVW